MTKSWRAIALPPILSVFMLASGAAVSARAASVERQADGRVIVSALSQRLYFRERDAEWIELWPPGECGAPKRVNLAKWLSDSQMAECLNRAFPDSGGRHRTLFISMPAILDSGRIFPGNVEPTNIGGIAPLGMSVELMEAPRVRPETPISANPPVAAPLGYTLYSRKTSFEQDTYVLDASKRMGQASRSLRIECTRPGAPPSVEGCRIDASSADGLAMCWKPGEAPPEESCAVTLNSADGMATLNLFWRQKVDVVQGGPQLEWLNYDAAARQIADSIFMDRPAGDLQ
jgi:hypothetical protein